MILPVRPHFIFDMLPKEQRQDFIIPVPCRESGSPSMLEWALLIACGRIAGCANEPVGSIGSIFEIGTYKGQTARMLAANFPTADIHTLDLDTRQSDEALKTSGVTRHQSHSMRFDWAAFAGEAQFVFIDGAHDHETVASDSRNALRMLVPDSQENGSRLDPAAIVWHDYRDLWPGVKAACADFTIEHNLTLYHIEDTSLCVYLRGVK